VRHGCSPAKPTSPMTPRLSMRSYHAPAPDGAQIPVRLFRHRHFPPRRPGRRLFPRRRMDIGGCRYLRLSLRGKSPRRWICRCFPSSIAARPEHKSPIGPRDCEAAARWIATGPEELPVKPTSLILIGDSCGGAYAISTAIALRDAPAAVPVAAQLVFYPSADIARRYDSFRDFRDRLSARQAYHALVRRAVRA
jgi:acetyl esterase